MGKTHLCLEILKKWEDNFSSTPVTQIIWLSKTKCSAKFRQELESISRSLNVPLHVFDSHGVLTPSYQRAFKKYHDREKSEGLSETRQDIDDREVESEGEIEKDKKNKEDDDNHDECVEWLSSVIASRKRTNRNDTNKNGNHIDFLKGFRKKGPRAKILSPKSRLGGPKKTRDFLRLNDQQVRNQKSLLLRTDEPVPRGGAVMTRSRTANSGVETEETEKNPNSSRFFSEAEKSVKSRKRGETSKENETENSKRAKKEQKEDIYPEGDKEDLNEKNKEQGEKEEEKEMRQDEDFELKRGALIVADDAFVSNNDDESQETNPNVRSETLYKTIKHLGLIAEASSHHLGFSLIIISQSPQIVTGSSILANYARRLRQNIDIFVCFKMDSSTTRHFINTISTGEIYQDLKSMLNFATNPPSNFTIDPFDQRGCYPYFAFTLSNQACNPNLKYR